MTRQVTNLEEPAAKVASSSVRGEGAAHHAGKVARSLLDSFDEELPEQIVEAVGELVGPKDGEAPEDPYLAEIEKMDREIFSKAAMNVEGALRWAEVELPTEENPAPAVPEEWLRQYGDEKARVMHRIAMTANVPKNKMPAGMHMAGQVFVGMVKARSERVEKPRLNLTLVHIETKDHQYPEKLLGEIK